MIRITVTENDMVGVLCTSDINSKRGNNKLFSRKTAGKEFAVMYGKCQLIQISGLLFIASVTQMQSCALQQWPHYQLHSDLTVLREKQLVSKLTGIKIFNYESVGKETKDETPFW